MALPLFRPTTRTRFSPDDESRNTRPSSPPLQPHAPDNLWLPSKLGARAYIRFTLIHLLAHRENRLNDVFKKAVTPNGVAACSGGGLGQFFHPAMRREPRVNPRHRRNPMRPTICRRQGLGSTHVDPPPSPPEYQKPPYGAVALDSEGHTKPQLDENPP